MPWVLLLLALAAFAGAFVTTSMTVLVLLLLLALALLLAGVFGLVSRRVDSRTRAETSMIDPQELQRLREQAQARRDSATPAQQPGTPPTP